MAIMTKERAIEVLKAWDLNWSDSFTANEFEQAFAMAISALSADGEYIKKSELFDKTVRRNSIWNEVTNSEGKGLEEIVNDLPTYSFLNSAENKGDLISRQAVLDELEKWDWQDLYLPSHFKQLLDDVPSVENKGDWIPVAERLPEDYDRVLITVNGCRGLIVREAQYHKAQNEFEVLHNHDRWEVGEKGLLAWQPLPEPYKKGE